MSGFASYERTLSQHTSSIRSILASPLPQRDLPHILTADSLLSQADSLLAALDAEVLLCDGSHPPLVKARTNKVTRLRDELKPLHCEVKSELLRLERAELFASSGASTTASTGSTAISIPASEQYDPFGSKLVSTMSSLNTTTNTLQQTQQLCNETEIIGQATLSQLGGQREQLLNANKHVRETTGITGQARMVLRQMGRRAFCHKMCLYATIAALLLANCTVLYYGFFHHGK
jgi:hypothetical protein